ncbi:monooxygenase [Methylobacterium gregans]|uniref:FMNH(2)-dependent dimethylsulfone monooxygenase n=1 Tax=Methylobacterium gregans TaxID=374424 RepID=A0AA37MC77_9HYPH|nr:LLM class flavin-dependent oxidoreductase [Methylobacterium gregans]MDQ0521257.1 alkanesulfonate monooxygenase [Methylobacterium gregans]GJD80895.1 FMNH(2)-dependent dimethylsulfone monooxygenase [Methylobacterium gregans]GLS54421.1 monooxygenase [Methylobacterium gregans]
MREPPRFGIWAAVHGSRAAHHDPDEPDDASWERNRALVLEAESLGFDAVLVAQHTANPYDDERDQLEAWTASAALAALTRRIEIIAAIKPGLYHPVVLAKMALQIEHVAGGRFALNLVNAWNRAEFERAGLPFPDHDERYAYGREWIGLVDRLMRGERVRFEGRHFRLEDYQLRPAGTHRPRPKIYLGGESEPARALAADHADVWFINGQPLADVRALIADVAHRPTAIGPLRYALSAFVIARESDAEAQAEHARLLALAQHDAALRADTRARTDRAAVMFAKTDAAASRHVGTNGGTAARLVGSYETVAARIRAFHAAGIAMFMLQFQPFEAEMRRFAEHLIPRLRPQDG